MKKVQVAGYAALSVLLFCGCTLISADDDSVDPPGVMADAQAGLADARPDAGGGSAMGLSDAASEAGDSAMPVLEGLPREIAESICGALFRCCSEEDKERFFTPIVATPGFEGFVERVPPAVELDESSCTDVLEAVYSEQPFGSWIAGTDRLGVRFQQDAFDSCRAELSDASCGAEVRSALFDGRCFGWQPPGSAGVHRGIFRRTATVGDECQPVRDGVGAAYFGTCDPEVSFCCYRDPARPDIGCTHPYTAEAEPRVGTCVTVSTAGEECSALAPVQLCQTGMTCESSTSRCVNESEMALGTGEACVDARFNLLGSCTDGYCDLFGSRECTPFRSDGDSCIGAEECRSGACTDGRCAVLRFCAG